MTHVERIEYLMALPRETISPTELAQVLGGNPYSYNLAAKKGMFPYPCMWRGRNLRIFKQPILDVLIGNNMAA